MVFANEKRTLMQSPSYNNSWRRLVASRHRSDQERRGKGRAKGLITSLILSFRLNRFGESVLVLSADIPRLL